MSKPPVIPGFANLREGDVVEFASPLPRLSAEPAVGMVVEVDPSCGYVEFQLTWYGIPLARVGAQPRENGEMVYDDLG